MEHIALLIMLVAVFFLYRIAYPKQSVEKKDKGVWRRKSKPIPDVMGKSRYVLPRRKEPVPTPAPSQVAEKDEEKKLESEKKFPAVIPVEQLDKVFADNQNNDDDFEIDDDDNDNSIDADAEEVAELQQGDEIAYADGVTFNDLQTAAKVINEQPEVKEVSNEIVHVIKSLENTELFDLLVADNESKQSWIRAVVERNFEKEQPETADDEIDMVDYSSVISDFLPE